MEDDRVDDLVARWGRGDQQAGAELFRRYVDRLIALVRSRLAAKLVHRVDAEDVVQSAYRSFFASARDNRYAPQRDSELWQLLVTFTLRKLNDQVRRNTSAKRAVARESAFGSDDTLDGLPASLLTREPSPVEAVALADEVEQLMRTLEPHKRRILELRLQGCNIDEIAAETHCGERTVRYTLQKIKQRLQQWHVENTGS